MLKAILVNEKKNMNIMLREMINWNSLGAAVTATAETGEDALEAIMREIPDIVIFNAKTKGLPLSDIVHRAGGSGIKPDYVVIAGSRNFESVYRAMKCGISEYLVGAPDIRELNDTLLKICHKRAQGEMKELSEARERRMFEMNKDIIRRHFMSIAVEGNVDTINTINMINGDFLFSFRPGIYETMIICPDFPNGESISKTELESLLMDMGETVTEVLGEDCIEHVWFRRHTALMCVLNYTCDMHDKYVALFDRLSEMIAVKNGVVTMALGTRENELRDIPKSADAARNSLICRLTLGTGRIIPFGQKEFSEVKFEDVFTGSIERRMRSSIISFNSREMRAAIKEVFDALDGVEEVNPVLYSRISDKILDMLVDSMQEKDIMIGSIEAVTDDLKRMLLISPTPSQIQSTVSLWATTIIDRIVYDENTKESRAVRIARAYIKEHFMEQIKLEEMAKITNLNTSYFSNLFKKETGQNFSAFLIECRLNEARKLLKETTLTISEITERIGYGDSKYFSKLFVKNMGITPSEFRKVYA